MNNKMIFAVSALALAGCGRDNEVGRYQFIKDYGGRGAAFDTSTGTLHIYNGVARYKDGSFMRPDGTMVYPDEPKE